MPTVPSYLYTSRTEIESIFSTLAVTLRTDDLSAGDKTTFLNELIYFATETANLYLESFYDHVDLNDSYWVRRFTTYIAAYHAALRRGNPGQFITVYNEALENFAAVKNGMMQVPGLATKADFTPAMSNLVVDNRFRLHKLRVHPTISAGGTTGREQLAYIFPFKGS